MNQIKWDEYVKFNQVLHGGLSNSGGVEYIFKKWIPFGRFLDVGCGEQRQIENWVVEKGCSYMGVDLFPVKGRINAVQGDMHELPFEDKSFDVVFVHNVFEHSISPFIALNEFSRVLSGDGFIIIGLPIGEGHDLGEEHFLNLTYNQLLNLASKCNLSVEQTEIFDNMTFYKLVKIK